MPILAKTTQQGLGVIVEFQGLNQLIEMFDSIDTDLARELDVWANRMYYKIQREAQLEAPVDTGTLLNSIYTSAKGLIRGYVSTNTDYAWAVHDGHTFSNGRTVPANPYMERAIQNSDDYMNKELEIILDDFFGK